MIISRGIGIGSIFFKPPHFDVGLTVNIVGKSPSGVLISATMNPEMFGLTNTGLYRYTRNFDEEGDWIFIVVSGTYKTPVHVVVQDNSTVDLTPILNAIDHLRKLTENTEEVTINGKRYIYDDDNTTVIHESNLLNDAGGVASYNLNGVRREKQ